MLQLATFVDVCVIVLLRTKPAYGTADMYGNMISIYETKGPYPLEWHTVTQRESANSRWVTQSASDYSESADDYIPTGESAVESAQILTPILRKIGVWVWASSKNILWGV